MTESIYAKALKLLDEKHDEDNSFDKAASALSVVVRAIALDAENTDSMEDKIDKLLSD